MRVHKGKDGCVRQLCGPGISTLQGHTKKVPVQQQRAMMRTATAENDRIPAREGNHVFEIGCQESRNWNRSESVSVLQIRQISTIWKA